MTANRSRKQVKNAHKILRNVNKVAGCPFCNIHESNQDALQETKHFFVIKNILPYDLWDHQKIKDHLMIVPKVHTEHLGSIGASAAIEYVELIDKYEQLGYDLYARSPLSQMKSVPHQHSHLLRPHGRRRRFVLYIKKPYIRLHF